ncbi:phosphotransferase [Nocardia sp. NPDC005366]|uniref:phosphotransferase n=1 Tax=Nocardia sp. NPDC005366 TaxID=3156878 RepID=UPI0033BE0FE0
MRYRLGDDLAVRLPWATESADALLHKECTWLPALARHPPLPVPVPQRFGEPSERFPRPWIVTTWVPGEPADRSPVTRATQAATTLAAFLTALHQPAPEQAPTGRNRGAPLADCSKEFAEQLASATELRLIPDPGAVRAVWEDAASAPDWTPLSSAPFLLLQPLVAWNVPPPKGNPSAVEPGGRYRGFVSGGRDGAVVHGDLGMSVEVERARLGGAPDCRSRANSSA